MTSVGESRRTTERSGAAKLPVFDCDVHERFVSLEALFPYLDEVWHGYRPAWAPGPPYDLGPLNGGGMRDDAWPKDYGYGSGMPGSSFELFRDQILDAYDISGAVLTGGALTPGNTHTQAAYALALTSAYNDWLAAEWLSRDERLLGAIQIAYHDAEAAAAEIDRMAANPQIVQVMVWPSPQPLGAKRLRPIFEAAARHDLVVAMHPGGECFQTAIGYPPYYTEWHIGLAQLFMAHVTNLIFSGVLDEYPNLRILVLEADFSWVPSLRWRMDANWKGLRVETPWLQRKPSEVMREQFYFGTQPIPEPDTPQQLLDLIQLTGEDNLVFASDYPHWDFDSEDRALPVSLLGLELRNKLVNLNAMRLYSNRFARVGSSRFTQASPHS
jgi:predicted TIM-barrel fold metal-dependent hydrolase